MPFRSSTELFMMPCSCMHCYLALSCHTLPKHSHVSPCPSDPPSGTRPPEQPGGSQGLQWTWPSRIWGGVHSKTGCPTQQPAQVTTDPQPPLPPSPICRIREFPLPGMFLLQQMLWSWANTALGHLCTPTYQTIMLELTELTYCSPNRQNPALG